MSTQIIMSNEIMSDFSTSVGSTNSTALVIVEVEEEEETGMEEDEMLDAEASDEQSTLGASEVQELTEFVDPSQVPLPPSPTSSPMQLVLPMAPTHALIPRTDGKPEATHRPKKIRVAPKELKRKASEDRAE